MYIIGDGDWWKSEDRVTRKGVAGDKMPDGMKCVMDRRMEERPVRVESS